MYKRQGFDRLYRITRNGLDPYYGYTKILWIKEHEPENWARIRCFLPPNAYAIYRMTGEAAIDYSSAGNLGGIFDMERRCWSGELMEALGIPRAMMPDRVVDSSAVVGGLTPECAAELGLPAGTPVCAGGVDCTCLLYTSGMVDACAVGNVFASPAYTKMASAIRAVDSGAGVLCLYGNYGGDKMNFQQAIEDCEFDDIRCRSVLACDDVASSPRETAEKRRGVAGILYALSLIHI